MAVLRPSRRSVLAWLGASVLANPAKAAGEVDLALVLAIDCSYSVDDYAYRQQLRGTSQAMFDSELLQLIEHGREKVIAVSAFLWSSPATQQVIVPWRILQTAGEANQVADQILMAQRQISAGATATGNALAYAEALLKQAPAAMRRVVDVSTNGRSNMGEPVVPVRDRLIASGITINGLAITSSQPDLVDYMVKNVTGGPNSFVITANSFNAYSQAIRLKLFREIAGLQTA